MLLNFRCLLRTFRADQRGVSALEYGLMVGLVALAIVAAVSNLGTTMSGTFNTVTASV